MPAQGCQNSPWSPLGASWASRPQKISSKPSNDTQKGAKITPKCQHFAPPGGHPAFDRTAGRWTKNDLAPSSDRPERAVDTWYHRGMDIFHHGIDSRGPGGDPEALAQKLYIR